MILCAQDCLSMLVGHHNFNYMQFIVYETDFSEGPRDNERNGRCASNRVHLHNYSPAHQAITK